MSSTDGSSDDGKWRFELIEAERRQAVLAKLMKNTTLWGLADGNASGPGLDDEQLWAARDHRNAIRAVALVTCRPGRTATLFLSRPPRRGLVDQTAELARCACSALDVQRVALVQVLLDQHDDLERLALERAGFEELAWLEYLQRPIGRSHRPSDLPPDVTLATWTPQRRDDFLAMLEASYEQTLDCPNLCGKRRTQDILAAHRATGMFRDDFWTLLMVEGRPAGVMLLADLPGHHLVELVYLGLALEHRGRGLGRLLLQRALHQCAGADAGYLCTAVDQRNAPARHLYRSMGFDLVAGKLAMILLLNEK